MIRIRRFSGHSESDCFDKINREIDDNQIINVIPIGKNTEYGWDEYDSYTTYSVDVVYRD